MLAKHRKIRPWRAFAYFLLAAGGLIIWVDPFRQMEQDVPFLIRWVWTGFIAFGGLVSMLGAITDRWLLEFVALPLVIVGFGGMVFVLVAGGGNTARLAFACWLSYIVVQAMRRWGGLWRFSTALRRAKQDGGQHA
jgi:hypothetical protein